MTLHHRRRRPGKSKKFSDGNKAPPAPPPPEIVDLVEGTVLPDNAQLRGALAMPAAVHSAFHYLGEKAKPIVGRRDVISILRDAHAADNNSVALMRAAAGFGIKEFTHHHAGPFPPAMETLIKIADGPPGERASRAEAALLACGYVRAGRGHRVRVDFAGDAIWPASPPLRAILLAAMMAMNAARPDCLWRREPCPRA